ncbi:Hypothetical predicted protein [Pelobates cultripes]|uniref:Uncharacterized protein n=1 Tax=Pelobates cultripes TaxID=61616 RepID=A0AAD1R941_PELCU|nr:Hypothetical predicted protein [Pelobates cultripes]
MATCHIFGCRRVAFANLGESHTATSESRDPFLFSSPGECFPDQTVRHAPHFTENIKESDTLTIITSLKDYTSSINSSRYQVGEMLSIFYILGNLTEAAVQSNFRFNVDTVKNVGYIANQLFSGLSTAPSTSVNNNLGPQLLGRLENILAEMEVTNESFNIYYGNVDLQCSVASCDDMDNGAVLVLDSSSSVSLPRYDAEHNPKDCLVNVLSMSYTPEHGSFNAEYGNQESVSQTYFVAMIQKLLRPSISEGSSEDVEVVKKLVKAVVFCTPQFGLTWAIGIPMFANNSLVLQYMFVLLNPLQIKMGCIIHDDSWYKT